MFDISSTPNLKSASEEELKFLSFIISFIDAPSSGTQGDQDQDEH
jgi:hypothetical protein